MRPWSFVGDLEAFQAGRRRIGEIARDLVVERGLIALERQDIVAAALDDRRGDGWIGGDGVDRDQRALERQVAKLRDAAMIAARTGRPGVVFGLLQISRYRFAPAGDRPRANWNGAGPAGRRWAICSAIRSTLALELIPGDVGRHAIRQEHLGVPGSGRLPPRARPSAADVDCPIIEPGVVIDAEAEASRAAVRLQRDREAGGGALALLENASATAEFRFKWFI
jgi:hypothetical protein